MIHEEVCRRKVISLLFCIGIEKFPSRVMRTIDDFSAHGYVGTTHDIGHHRLVPIWLKSKIYTEKK